MADALVDGPPLPPSNGALRLGETGDSQKSDESTPEKMTLKRAGSALRTMSGVDRALSGDEVVPLPDVWEKTDPSGSGKGQKVEIGRMVNDYLRRGMNNDEVRIQLSKTQMEFVMAMKHSNGVGISDDQLMLARRRLDQELPGVPPASRLKYRDALITCMGGKIVPWDLKAGGAATNKLDLSRLKLTQIPRELFGPTYCGEIRNLTLTDNDIEDIPPEIANLSELAVLKLEKNKVKSIPVEVIKLTKLSILSLKNNKLLSVPNEVGQLTKLSVLDVEHNHLEMLPITLGRLVAAGRSTEKGREHFKLNPSNNPKMYGPPAHIVQKGSTSIMDYLRRMDDGDQSGTLTLRDLNLTELPREMLSNKVFNCLRVYGTTIKALYLDNNKISSIEDTMTIVGAQEDVAKQLSDLRTLSLANNTLRKVPHVLCNLSSLTSLNLQKNSLIKSLPVEMGNLTSLTELKITIIVPGGGNQRQFISPPKEILDLSVEPAEYEDGEFVRAGTAGIAVHYLRMIMDAKTSKRLYHMKMGLRALAPELVVLAEGEYGLEGQTSFGTEAEVAKRAQEDRMSRLFTEPLGRILDLEYMYLSRNRISRLPACLAVFKSLRVLNADWNALAELPASLGDLVLLEELSLAYNKLENLPDTLKFCTSLCRVDLHCNRLTKLTKMAGGWTMLEILRLDGNMLQNMASGLRWEEDRTEQPAQGRLLSSPVLAKILQSKLNLTAKEWADCGIDDLQSSDYIKSGDSFFKPAVSSEIPALPHTLGNCVRLRVLNLSNNKLTKLPDELSDLTQLQHLIVDGNMLATLPQEIGQCIQLRQISMDRNNLVLLPISIGYLRNLQLLSAADNPKLLYPPQSVFKLGVQVVRSFCIRIQASLDEGDLGLKWSEADLAGLVKGSEVKSESLAAALQTAKRTAENDVVFKKEDWLRFKISNLSSSSHIKVGRLHFKPTGAQKPGDRYRNLNLSHMHLSDFPLGLEDNIALTILDMSHNEIKVVPDSIALLENLTTVRLQFNRIRALPDNLGKLSQLTSLHVNNNVLTTLPQSLAALDRLTDLCVQANKMVTLPMCIGALLNLRSFSASDNPLKEPPDDIINGKNSSKLTYNYMRGVFDAISSGCMTLEGFGLRDVPDPALRQTTLDAIMLGKNRIASLPDAIGGLKYLRKLSLKSNSLTKLTPALAKLRTLQLLTLSDNQLTSFDPVLLEVSSLKILSLEKNQILSVPERIDRLPNLLSLSISDNPISRLPGSICKLTNLTELRFSDTKVRKIPMSFGTLSLLRALECDAQIMEEPCPEVCTAPLPVLMNYFFEFLDCYNTNTVDYSGHSMKQFPTEFMSFRHHETKMILGYSITMMDISRNRLSSLPNEFADFGSLRRLDLSFNSFHRIPGALCWLTALEFLNLEGNYHLNRLPLEMGEMKDLREFRLSHDRFITPPQEVLTKVEPNDHHDAHLGVIEYLQLLVKARDSGKIKMSRMGLRQFPPEIIVATSMCWDYGEVRGIFMTGRGHLDAIQEVHLDHNNIQQLPAAIGQMLKVKILNVSSNYIKVLPASIANMTELTTLNVSSNRICIVNPIISMISSLTKLQLQDNNLTVIPEVVGSMLSLLEISFSQNRLTELPQSLPKLTNLRNLLASDNRLKTDASNWGLPGVSHEIAYMPNLIEINLEKNDFLKVPPKDVRQASSENQLRFLRRVHEARTSSTLILEDLVMRELSDIIILMVNLHTLTISSCGLRSVNPNIKRLTNLTYLELDNNDLVVVPEDATRISNLTELRLNKNQMKKLPETCNRWIRCSKIYATDNHIHTIPDAVCEMPNLTVLDLDRNKLRTLPEAFIICSSLTLLHFDTSDMVKASPAKELPDGIRRCEIPAEIAIRGVDMIIDHFFKMHEAWSTNSLDLRGIGLRYVMHDVCLLSVLTKLDLSHNRLKCLPSAFSTLVDLKLVNLDHNMNLEHFHHDLWTLTKLKKITIRAGILDSWLRPIITMKWPPTILARQPDVCRQYLKVVFDCVGRHYRKDGVDVVDSTLKLDFRFVQHEVSLDPVTAGEIESEATRAFLDFPHEIWALGLTNLTWLQLPGGKITAGQMETHLPKLTDLKKLVLIDQDIHYIPDQVALLTDLNVLCLTGNKIKEIPDFIFKMISMTKLILVENYIEKVPPEIGLLTNLTDLVLTYNRISVLPKEIGELWGLDYLVLDENKIRVLPDSIQHLTSLKEFSFNDNKITRFPASMGNLTQLEILEFSKNPKFTLPPTQVLKCEVPVVLGFMNNIWACRETGRLHFRNFQLDDKTTSEILREVYTCLTDLDLSKNYLKHLSSNLKHCTGLTKINLSQNSKLTTLNLQSEIEVKKREVKKAEIVATNLTLRAFFEGIEMMELYEIVSKEYGVKKMKDLNNFIQDEDAMENLGLNPLEKMRFLDAVHKINGDPDSEKYQDKIEHTSASEAHTSDVDSGKDEADDGEEVEGEQEEVLDDEEAQRLLEDAKGNRLIKFDMEMLKDAAYKTKVLFYEMVVMVKAKLIERQRRKELAILDKRVEKRANGFRKKLMRNDEHGLGANTKKKIAEAKKKLENPDEEMDEKTKAALAKKAEMMAERDKIIGGNVENIDLKIEVGGGIVKESIYSLAIFTNLTDLRVRKCKLEYIPEDIGDLTGLVHLDLAKNDIRWFPPSFTNLVNLKEVDIRNNLIFELPPMIGNCEHLRELRLDHNKLYDLPQSMATMPMLRKVTLDHNKFQILPNWINELEHLQTLTFSYNEVDKLPNTFLELGSTLTELRCSYNKLPGLSTMFSSLQELKILDISGNPVKSIPKFMGKCKSLEELHINYCSLETIDIHLALCRNLCILKYEGNDLMRYPPREVQVKGPELMIRFFRQIVDCPRTQMMLLDKFDLAEFDSTILNYPRMTWLNMSNNNMMKIPAEIRQLQFLELIDFSHNKLTSMPRILCMMLTVTDLSLDGNGIERIEPSIMLLTGLTRLSLSENKINRVHPSIFRLTNLELLNFNQNEIEKLPGLIAELANLDSLGFGSNYIEELPSEIRVLTKLRQLVLYGNRLKSLPNGLRSLTKLEVLTVSQNSLREFPPSIAMGLVSLRELWMTHNKLTYLPSEIRFMSRLEQLWLQDNRLVVLPHELGDLTTLKVLAVTGNKISEIPQHVKDLRITKEENREEDEEFWQDKERDGFSKQDADRLLMKWSSDPKATQDVFDDANVMMFSGALQAYYYASKGSPGRGVPVHFDSTNGKKADDSDADDEEEEAELNHLKPWTPPKKNKLRKDKTGGEGTLPRTAADEEYEAEIDFGNLDDLVRTAQKRGQEILSNSLNAAERNRLASATTMHSTGDRDSMRTSENVLRQEGNSGRSVLRTAGSAHSANTSITAGNGNSETDMSSVNTMPRAPATRASSTVSITSDAVPATQFVSATGTNPLAAVNSTVASHQALNQTMATDISGPSTMGQTRATDISGASTLNQTRATDISAETTIRRTTSKKRPPSVSKDGL